jgi:hypothetical protein
MKKPTLGGGLRGGDMAPPKLVLEKEFPPNVDRDLLQTATVRLINNCGVMHILASNIPAHREVTSTHGLSLLLEDLLF